VAKLFKRKLLMSFWITPATIVKCNLALNAPKAHTNPLIAMIFSNGSIESVMGMKILRIGLNLIQSPVLSAKH